MPAAVISNADAQRIATALRARGADVPAGLEKPKTEPAKPKPKPATKPAAEKKATEKAGKTPAAATTPAAAAGHRRARRRRRSTLGDAGGVLLALWLYPIGLAFIQHGPAGPGMWLRAKFLNADMTGAANTDRLTPAAPAAPSSPSTRPAGPDRDQILGPIGGPTAMRPV